MKIADKHVGHVMEVEHLRCYFIFQDLYKTRERPIPKKSMKILKQHSELEKNQVNDLGDPFPLGL